MTRQIERSGRPVRRSRTQARALRLALAMVTLVGLQGCGGGGGGSGGGDASGTTRVDVSSRAVSAEARVTDASTPPISVTLRITRPPGDGLFVRGTNSQNGVDSLAPGASSSTSAEVLIVLKAPHLLAPGTYTDEVTLAVCLDETCNRHVAGSPISIDVRYVVAAVTGADAPALVVAATSYFAQALPTDVVPPAEVNTGVAIQNVPAFPIYIAVSHSSNGLASASLPAFFQPGAPGSEDSSALTIRYRAPAELATGLIQDTATITACLDPACVNPLVGSPAVIHTSYQIGNDLPGADGYTVTTVPLKANDLVWDRTSSTMYVAIATDSIQHPTSLVQVDPATSTIVASRALAAEPSLLAISDDGQYLYVAIRDSTTIERYALPGLTLDATLDIGTDPQGFDLATWDMQVAPDEPLTIAVSRTIAANPPQSRGVVIVDDVTRRANVASTDATGAFREINYIHWGADSGTLYGSDSRTSAAQFVTMSVDPTGAYIAGSWTLLPAGRMHFLQGFLYFDRGTVFDPVVGAQVGALPGAPVEGQPSMAGLVAVDELHSRIFRLRDNSGGVYNYIEIFDLDRYELLKRFTIIGHTLRLSPYAKTRLVRWGSNGLAYASADGAIVIVRGAYLTS